MLLPGTGRWQSEGLTEGGWRPTTPPPPLALRPMVRLPRRGEELAGWVAQPSEEAGWAQAPVGRAAPLGFELLDSHHIVDPAVEEGCGVAPAFGLVVEPREEGRAIHRAQGHALGVVIEVGADIASNAPHVIGGAPADAQRERQVLRHCEDCKRPPHSFTGGANDLESAPDEGTDLLADLHALHPLGRRPGLKRPVDLLDVEVDQLRLTLRHCQPRLHRVDAELPGRGVDSLERPAVEHCIFTDRERQAPAQLFEGTRLVHAGQLGCSAGVRNPRSGRRTSTKAAAIAAAPSQSTGLRVSRYASQPMSAEIAGWVSNVSPTTNGGSAPIA